MSPPSIDIDDYNISDDGQISLESSDDTRDSDDDSNEDSQTLDSEIPGVNGSFYGGYGRCFRCKRRGHWAPGCPF